MLVSRIDSSIKWRILLIPYFLVTLTRVIGIVSRCLYSINEINTYIFRVNASYITLDNTSRVSRSYNEWALNLSNNVSILTLRILNTSL